jgi:dedicator of cytokinesis protein 3
LLIFGSAEILGQEKQPYPNFFDPLAYMTGIVPSASAPPSRKGLWEPLPLIIYGYAVHPLIPNRRDTQLSRARLSTVTEASTEDHFVNKDVVPLEVGDEIYAFEKYVPHGGEVDGIWYRG